MLIFKNIFRIVRANLPSYIIYILMPLVITVVYVFSTSSAPEAAFMAKGIKIAIDDRDNSPLSEALADYLLDGNERAESTFEQRTLRDDLFYGRIGYALIIPEGYFADHLSASPDRRPELKVGHDPDLRGAESLDERVDRFVSLAALHRRNNRDADDRELAARLLKELTIKGDVAMQSKEAAGGTPTLAFYFRFATYGLMSAALRIIMELFRTFRKPQIALRHDVSATPTLKISRSLLTGTTLILVIVFIVLTVPAAILFGRTVLEGTHPLLLLNFAAITVFSLALGLFLGSLEVRSENASSALSVGLPLLLSFFGGLFVPMEFIGESVKRFARYLPSYWYNDTIMAIERSVVIDTETSGRILTNFGILFLYTAVFVVAFFAVGRLKRRPGKTLRAQPVR